MTDTNERQQTLETIRKYKYISDMRFAMLTTDAFRSKVKAVDCIERSGVLI